MFSTYCMLLYALPEKFRIFDSELEFGFAFSIVDEFVAQIADFMPWKL